jgi:hypothetical protein
MNYTTRQAKEEQQLAVFHHDQRVAFEQLRNIPDAPGDPRMK